MAMQKPNSCTAKEDWSGAQLFIKVLCCEGSTCDVRGLTTFGETTVLFSLFFLNKSVDQDDLHAASCCFLDVVFGAQSAGCTGSIDVNRLPLRLHGTSRRAGNRDVEYQVERSQGRCSALFALEAAFCFNRI